MTAAILDWPQGTFASKVKVHDKPNIIKLNAFSIRWKKLIAI